MFRKKTQNRLHVTLQNSIGAQILRRQQDEDRACLRLEEYRARVLVVTLRHGRAMCFPASQVDVISDAVRCWRMPSRTTGDRDRSYTSLLLSNALSPLSPLPLSLFARVWTLCLYSQMLLSVIFNALFISWEYITSHYVTIVIHWQCGRFHRSRIRYLSKKFANFNEVSEIKKNS